jgi:hypothetical protein
MKPIFREKSKEYMGINFYMIDADENEEICHKLNVKSIKSKTIKSCVRQSNGWYKHTSTGLYIYFQTTDGDGKKIYSILYTYEMFDMK